MLSNEIGLDVNVLEQYKLNHVCWKCGSGKKILLPTTGLVKTVCNKLQVQNADFAFSDMATPT